MIEFGISAVGLAAPAISDWKEGCQLFQAGSDYDSSAELANLTAEILPANERRRTTHLIKLALTASIDATTGWTGDTNNLATVFASSCGDLQIVDKIMCALTLEEKPVSPTQFHNSVHNAPSGYWSIGSHSHAPSTSLSAYDGSFSAGLLEAACQLGDNDQPVMICAYDNVPPETLRPFRQTTAPFAAALLLTNDRPQWRARISLEQKLEPTQMTVQGLELLRLANPAARALPLLHALALGKPASVQLPYLDDLDLKIDISTW